mmetsp:Transcript_11011/g.21084  ORF Transcript_11011/g.21084 Transcript_11011/m.21084 type:complete len:207 (-) Transcript_11011:42-662(-)
MSPVSIKPRCITVLNALATLLFILSPGRGKRSRARQATNLRLPSSQIECLSLGNDVVNSFLKVGHLSSGILRNFNTESFLDGHDNLNSVQGVSTEVSEGGGLGHLLLLDGELLGNDILDLLENFLVGGSNVHAAVVHGARGVSVAGTHRLHAHRSNALHGHRAANGSEAGADSLPLAHVQGAECDDEGHIGGNAGDKGEATGGHRS